MPLYEYECDSCHHRFEVIQKFSDAPIDTCPNCGSAVHKLMSSPAIQFKGSGWYITDYAKKDSTAAAKSATSKEGSSKEGASNSNEAAKPSSDTSTSSAPAAAPSTTTKSD